MSFIDLNLCAPLLKSLEKCGYTTPTPIQAQAIPRVLEGKDLIATAQTGTGKTAAFVLPILQKLMEAPKQNLPRVLILSPVRELANQISDAIYNYKGQAHINVASIVGGMPYHAQMRQLAKADIIVATPGRLIDYIQRKGVNLSQVSTLILDEADRMLDMGFVDDVKLISKQLPKQRQTLMFTATLDEQIERLAHSLLSNPERIAIAKNNASVATIKQSTYITDGVDHKNQILSHLLDSENIFKAIIFSGTKHYADTLADHLNEQGFAADVLHGDIKQRKRIQTLKQFRTGKINYLVATDVAARGIDISDISHVINYDFPKTTEDYVHRIGRTGRAGRNGIAISFLLRSEMVRLKRIERVTGSQIQQISIPGLEPKQSASRPSRPRSGAKTGNGRNMKRFDKPYVGKNGNSSLERGAKAYPSRDGNSGRNAKSYADRDGAPSRGGRVFSDRDSNSPRGNKAFNDRDGNRTRSGKSFNERDSSNAARSGKSYSEHNSHSEKGNKRFAAKGKKPFSNNDRHLIMDRNSKSFFEKGTEPTKPKIVYKKSRHFGA